MAVIEIKNKVLKEGEHNLTSDYKTRNPERKNHNGMDFVSRKNNINVTEYIVAIDKGVVQATGYGLAAGYYVKIKHDNGYVSLYYHLKKGSIAVKKGAKVTKGKVIGYMGNTGNSRGAHLHFGVLNEKGKAVDPKPYLQGKETFAKEKTEIDGFWGKDTTKIAQRVFGTVIDGVVSNQNIKYKAANPGLLDSTFEWETKPGKNGSVLIKAIQKKIGTKQTGYMDTSTIKAMQKWLGTPVDGKVSKPSKMVKAFQIWLNNQ